MSIGPVKIFSYGVMLTLGLFIALYFWWKMGRDEHFDEIALFDGFFLSLLTYLVLGRVGYVLLNFESVGTLAHAIAFLAYPGLSGTVGIIGVSFFLFAFARAHNWNIWKIGDAYAVSLAIAIAFAGLGGILNGSNPGIEASWGLRYVGQSVKTAPVDLWIMIWGIVSFAIVSRVRKNFRFYTWYKAESSMAQEGLATLVFGLLIGFHYLVVGWIDQLNWKIWVFPGQFIIGLVIMGVCGYMISKRVGRRESTLWSKLVSRIRRN